MSQTRKNGSSTERGRKFKCQVCGHTAAKPELVDEMFTIGNRHVLVERVPAQVCEHCGEAIFSRETTENIRRLVHDSKRPIRTEPLDVFAMA